MKKKMLLICAALIGVVSITSAAVTSKNIVGYNKIAGPSGGGFTVIAPSFISVLGDDQTFTLNQITGNFANFDTIQLLDSLGNVESQVYYWAADNEWYDYVTDDLASDNKYVLGTGMFVYTGPNTFDGTVSGQVDDEDVVLSISSGLSLIGNSTPVPVTLGDIKFVGLNNFNTIQFLDSAGSTYSQAYYWAADGKWYDYADDEEADGWELAPALGFFLYCDGGVTVTIPKPL